MVALAVVAILATLALPSLQGPFVRQQVVDSATLINVAKSAVSGKWSATQKLPLDNAEAGLPEADKLVGNYVASVTVRRRCRCMWRSATRPTARSSGKTLSFRPAVVDSAPMVPIAWVCGPAATPDKMSAKGADRTDVAAKFLPLNCR